MNNKLDNTITPENIFEDKLTVDLLEGWLITQLVFQYYGEVLGLGE